MLSVNETENHSHYERRQYGDRYVPKEAHGRIPLPEGAPVTTISYVAPFASIFELDF